MRRLPRPALISAFVLALALSLFFAMRLIMGTIYWADAAHQDQPIEGWMRLGYVARSWDVPRDALIAAMQLPAETMRFTSIERIAQDQGIPVPELIARIEGAIAAHRDGGTQRD